MRKFFAVIFVFVLTLIMFGSFNEYVPMKNGHSISYYDNAVRRCFKNNKWQEGKRVLDEAKKKYDGVEPFYELTGWYYYHVKDYNNARYNLKKCLINDNSNTHSREMLVDVEDFTGHYSGALCYVNELLENNPYSKKWWLRKINLYRKLKNDAEAERCLERLGQIYPNDITIKDELNEKYLKQIKSYKEKNDIRNTLSVARKLVDCNPTSDNYIQLVNALYSSGNISQAENAAKEGYSVTKNGVLLKKYIGMLCEQGRHYQALLYLTSIGSAGNALKDEVNEDMAAYSTALDPYMAQAKVYERTHSKESFDYLVNTGIVKGYYDAVIDYILEWEKRGGNSSDILYKKYVAYSRLGKEAKALETLEKIYNTFPTRSLADELSSLYYAKATRLIEYEEYGKAVNLLSFVIKNSLDADLIKSANDKLASCYYEMKMYDEYVNALDPNDSLYNEKKAFAMALQGKNEDALTIVNGEAYVEIAMPYIKTLIQKGEYSKAKTIVDKALMFANDKELYMYAISCASELGENPDTYIINGYNMYKLDDYFVKQYSSMLNGQSIELMKAKDYEHALLCVDSALAVKRGDKELLYTKGLIYEKKHEYDSAYVYQKYYVPDVSDMFSHKQRMAGLYMRTLKNTITADYHQARMGQLDIITSNASIGYDRILRNGNTWGFSLGYIGRDDTADSEEYITEQTPGGIGLQFTGRYAFQFHNNWELSVSAAYGTMYFPKLNVRASVTKTFSNELSLGAYVQYRKVDSYTKVAKTTYDELGSVSYVFDHWNHVYQNMWTFGINMNKPAGQFDLNAVVNGFLISKKAYFSVNTKVQYTPFDGSKTRLFMTAGCGTAPEITLIDYAMPKSFEKMNANVGIGGVYVLTKNLSIGLEGTWHTMYKQTEVLGETNKVKQSYVNLYYIHPMILLTF